jgi:hypothetical protein
VSKFNASGTNLEYSTLLGVSGGSASSAIAVDESGNAYVAGSTYDLAFPTTPGAFQTTNLTSSISGDIGTFLTKLNSTGSSLLYSTYLSGSGFNTDDPMCECIYGLALDGSGNVYVTGRTFSNDFPITAAAYDTTPGWLFVTKFNGAEMKQLPVPTVIVTSNANPQTPDTPVIFTAQVVPASGVSTPTGTVSFSIDENIGFFGYPLMGRWETVSLDGTGTATYTTTNLAGQNLVSAYYLGDANNAPGSGSMTETVSAGSSNLPTVVVATANANPVPYGTRVRLNISVQDPSGKGIPSGYIQIGTSGQFGSWGTTSLDTNGNATITIGPLPAGANDLVIYYGNFGGNYGGSIGYCTVNVTPLGIVPAPVFSLSSGTYDTAQTLTITDAASPDAMILFTIDGTTPTRSTGNLYSGSLAITYSQTIKAIAIENGYTNSPVTSAAYNFLAPTPVITPPGGTYDSAQQVTITDAITAVTIYCTTDGTTPISSSPQCAPGGAITVNRSETIKAIAIPIQSWQYSNSNVASATFVIQLPDFSVGATPSSISVIAGQSGTAMVTITPQYGFSSMVQFSCSGLPSGASCSFSPQTVTPTSSSASTTLTVTTSASSAALHRNSLPLLPGSALAVAFCWLGWRRRRRLQMLLLIAVSLAGLSILNGCGGGGSGSGGSGGSTHQPTISTVTVTATSGSLSHTTTFVLTVN